MGRLKLSNTSRNKPTKPSKLFKPSQLKMKLIPICLSTLILASCNGLNPVKKITEHQKPEVSTLFDDIDLYNLEGVRPLPAKAMFPYINIQDLGTNKRRIVYQRAPGDSTERIYEKQNGLWTTHYPGLEDGVRTSIWEFISPEKITELEYTASQSRDAFYLTAVTMYSKDKSVSYIIDEKKKITFNPVATALDSVANDISTMYLEDQELKNGVLTLIDTKVDGKTKKSYPPDTLRRNTGNHSYFWYRQMYTLIKE